MFYMFKKLDEKMENFIRELKSRKKEPNGNKRTVVVV